MPGERKRMERLEAKIAVKLEELAAEAEAERNRIDDDVDSGESLWTLIASHRRTQDLQPPLPGFLDDMDEDDEHDLEAVIEHSRMMAVAQTVAHIYRDLPLGANLKIANQNLDALRSVLDVYQQNILGQPVRVEGVHPRRRVVPPAQSRTGRREAGNS